MSKKVKKATPRKVTRKKKTVKRKRRTINPEIELHRKINQILIENPKIECDLTGEDDEGRKYGYVEAAAVFRMYNQAFKKHHLTICPVSIVPMLGKNCVLINAIYKLTDIETGYSIMIAGCGLGANGQWAANSGQTLALKQALLNTFLCSWPQPENFRDEVNRDAKKMFSAATTPQEIGEATVEYMKKYFDDQYAKRRK